MNNKVKDFDIVVVGGGHAGIEAASASARMDFSVALITMDKRKIGLMSCNPAIGGLAKGQLVREIDALGGEMAKITDEAGIHFKMLNKSKGPAVWSPRAQTDRQYYSQVAQKRLSEINGITIIESNATGLEIENDKIRGVVLGSGEKIFSKIVILSTGTFLNGRIHIGLKTMRSGRAEEESASGITETLVINGLETGRLKTGTPPRLHKDSIDFDKFEIQEPDNPPEPFSFETESIEKEQVPCFIGHTNSETHKILREGFDESPLYQGRIKAVGPRYCPSIEDKINRFADRERHQLFLEPEGYDNPEIYLNGFSTSLPELIQERAVKSIPGFEKAEIIRLGYAVEYDFFPPHQLHHTLESKLIKGLYFAGQINGTSGYEEAAAQGIVAGINAALKLKDEESFNLSRSEAYIGVLIDDLINKSTLEPYRMFTSRAEFRLLLRQDNADLRLSEYGKQFGLISEKASRMLERKQVEIASLTNYVTSKKIEAITFNQRFTDISSKITRSTNLKGLIKRPEINLSDFLQLMDNDIFIKEAVQEVEFNIKYDGYIKRNQELIDRFKQQEDRKIPSHFDYNSIDALSAESKEKLNRMRPSSFGNASRISGVSPADLSVLLIYLERERHRGIVSRETNNTPT